MTFCPHEKLIGQATDINDGIAGGAKGVAAVPRRPVRATAAVRGDSGAAGATDYGGSSGRRSNSHPLAGARAPSSGRALLQVARQNKGLHRTAHKLPNLRGLAMIQPVEATHYFACALSGEP